MQTSFELSLAEHLLLPVAKKAAGNCLASWLPAVLITSGAEQASTGYRVHISHRKGRASKCSPERKRKPPSANAMCLLGGQSQTPGISTTGHGCAMHQLVEMRWYPGHTYLK